MDEEIRFSLRIPASLYEKLKQLSEKEHRSINQQIVFIIDQAVKEDEHSIPDVRL